MFVYFLCSFPQLAQNRGQQGQHCCYQEEQAQGTGVEDAEIAIAHDQGAHEVLLRHATQDDADDDGRHGEAQFIEEIAQKAAHHHQIYVVKRIVVGIGTHKGHHHDDGQ